MKKLYEYNLAELERLYDESNEDQQKDLIQRIKNGEWNEDYGK